jgi:hypothetical protein
MPVEQLPLFPDQPSQGASRRTDLSARSSLGVAMERFREHMIQQDLAENTVKSFLGDLRILQR